MSNYTIDNFSSLSTWFDTMLNSYMPSWLATTLECVLVGVGLLLVYSVLALFYILYERKICAYFQCRLGPNRVGPWGLLQSIADMFKILIKELISLNHIDKFLFALAPYLVIIASMLCFAVLPWGNGLQIIDFNIGIFFLLACSSIGVLGILLAGWSSNNKFTLIGALRSGAQMVSYELSVGLSILTMVVFAGTMDVGKIVTAQADHWFIFSAHIPAIIAFIIYMIAGTAETNRGPAGLPGCCYSVVLRRLDAFSCGRMGRIQRDNGLHTLRCMVPGESICDFVHNHLVQMDLSPSPHRPAPLSGVEISSPRQPCQPRPDGMDCG